MSNRRLETLGVRRRQTRIEAPARSGYQGRYGTVRCAGEPYALHCYCILLMSLSSTVLEKSSTREYSTNLGGLAHIPDRKYHTTDDFFVSSMNTFLFNR